MDELRESSLLFSLEGLLETERERVQREAREAQRRRDDEMIRVAEQASRRRLAAEQEREARERRVALEQERERLEAERIDAMKRATVERARIETEGKLRLVEVEQARRHELMLSQLRAGQQTARYRSLTWLSSAACALSVAGALVVHFGYVRPAYAREAQQLQATIRVNAEQAKTTERALAAERSRNQTLSERIARLEAQQNASAPVVVKPAPVPTHGGRGPSTGNRGGTSTTQETPCVDNGDPLQGCLSGRRR
jgi:hypothetical protein